MLELVVTSQFKRDAKLAQRRGKKMELLRALVLQLQHGEMLASVIEITCLAEAGSTIGSATLCLTGC